MDFVRDLFHNLHGKGLEHLIQTGGFVVLFSIVFAETGLFFGFFLPGDSLLFTAGALVGAGVLKAPPPFPETAVASWLMLNAVLMTAAILGDQTGYWFGRKAGRKLFTRRESRFFKREHLLRTQAFYERHGGKTLILARWMPFARTFAPIVAGVAEMEFLEFLKFSVVGGVTWIFSCTTAGFLLGNLEPVKKHFEKVIIVIILLSITPAIIHFWREARHSRAAKSDAPTPAGDDGEGAE